MLKKNSLACGISILCFCSGVLGMESEVGGSDSVRLHDQSRLPIILVTHDENQKIENSEAALEREIAQKKVELQKLEALGDSLRQEREQAYLDWQEKLKESLDQELAHKRDELQSLEAVCATHKARTQLFFAGGIAVGASVATGLMTVMQRFFCSHS